jgi:hypothetical protein
MSKSSTTLFTEPTESHARTERQIGIYLRDHCPGLSISDFTDAKKDRSTYWEMAAAYKSLVKAYAPKREPNEKGRLVQRSYRNWDEDLKRKVYKRALKLFPELARFANNWLGKKLATNVINNKNANEAAAAIKMSAAPMAGAAATSQCECDSIW